MTDIEITHSFDPRDLAEIIGDAGLPHDELLEFVILLDANVADWDFTIKLRDALTADIPQDVQDDHDLAAKLAAQEKATQCGPFAFYDFIIKN